MRIVISELMPSATCEFSGKTGECVRVVLDQNTAPAVIATRELIKLVRFHAQQEAKRTAQAPAAAAREQPAGEVAKQSSGGDR